MRFTTEELHLIREALGQLDAEYGRPEAVALSERVWEEIERREARDSE